MDANRTTCHSQKPKEVYNFIKKMFKLEQMNCLEIFSRERNEENANFDLYGY